MKPAMFSAGCLLVAAIALCAWGADNSLEWKSGTLLETEKQQVRTGNTQTTNSDGTIKEKQKGKKADYSQTTTSRTTEDYDTFQVYTIQGDGRTYMARERLLFPWSKPANLSVGEKVKYVVQKNTLYLLDDDGKQHKAGISKISMNQAAEQK
ncbi:MAG TPA: hypothetical protein VGE93_18720 [Bryobacteraceae bacterium]